MPEHLGSMLTDSNTDAHDLFSSLIFSLMIPAADLTIRLSACTGSLAP